MHLRLEEPVELVSDHEWVAEGAAEEEAEEGGVMVWLGLQVLHQLYAGEERERRGRGEGEERRVL